MKTCLLALLCCITLAATLALAQSGDEGFQTATVVAFERVPEDARHMEKGDQYKISLRLGNTIYNCHANAPASTFIDWTTGKEFPVKINDKLMLAKNPNGQIVELNIVGKKTPK
jgi:hypothetical protein